VRGFKAIEARPTCEMDRQRHPQGIHPLSLPVDIGGSARDSRRMREKSRVKLLAILGGENKPRFPAPY
jgi:hypothetical protein